MVEIMGKSMELVPLAGFVLGGIVFAVKFAWDTSRRLLTYEVRLHRCEEACGLNKEVV